MYPKEKSIFSNFFNKILQFLFLAVQFDKAGRPYHFLYYTAKQNYYDVLHVKTNIFLFILFKF
jgi:hypothetical protein